MKTWEERGWQEEDLNKLELGFLQRIFILQESFGVDAALFFARYLSMVGVHPDNYPIFLKILALKNHWVVDALVGDKDPEMFFKDVQPNYYIVKECFRAFASAKKGGIYEKSLHVYLGVLKVVYTTQLEGYRIYPLNQTDVNNLGKHLDEKQDQMYPLNRSILSILDNISSLTDPGRPEDDQDIIAVATQANNIRGKFLDMTKSLKEAIPEEMLENEVLKEVEIAPSVTPS